MSLHEFANAPGRFDALPHFGYQGNSYAAGTRVGATRGRARTGRARSTTTRGGRARSASDRTSTARGTTRQVTSRQHSHVLRGKQVSREPLVIAANVAPKIEAPCGTLDGQHIRQDGN